MAEIVLDPLEGQDMEDTRDKISENIFIELDIVKKCYLEHFGEDRIFEDVSFVISNFAFLLRSHKNEHILYNIDIDKIVIPDSKYKNEDGLIVDNVPNLSPIDKLSYFANLLLNTKLGITELHNSKYFEESDEQAFLMPLNNVVIHILNKIDEILLRMNITLNKL